MSGVLWSESAARLDQCEGGEDNLEHLAFGLALAVHVLVVKPACLSVQVASLPHDHLPLGDGERASLVVDA